MKNIFEKEFLYSLKTLAFCHYYKVPSPPPRSRFTRFYTPRPYDFFLLKDGVFCAIELKYTNKESSFPLNKFKKYQIEALKEVKRYGGLAIVVINIRQRNPRNISAYAFDIEEIESLYQNGRASIPKDYLLSGYKLLREKPEGKRYIWRIDLLFQHFLQRNALPALL
ncbi:MAG: Holliday junction resolvase RecU [bacterium]